MGEDITWYTQDPTIPQPIRLPDEYVPLWKYNSSIGQQHAIQYLENRNINITDIQKYQIGYCDGGKYAGRVIIPSYDKHCKLNYFVGRAIYDDSYRNYLNPEAQKNLIIGFESQIYWKDSIVLCEGVFDAIAIRRQAIPLLGKSPSTNLQERIIESNIRRIYLALDKDALRETLRLAQHFMDNGREIYIVKMEEKDPGSIGFTGMQKLIQKAREVTFSELIRLKVNL